jgi:hypothetical protein
MAERKVDQEKREAEWKDDRRVATRLQAIHDKTDANQMTLEPETEHKGNKDAWIAYMKNNLKEKTT